jgi:aarF domain-containing kinase
MGGIYVADQTFNASAISRNFRTLWTCAIISADYKINFTPEHADRIPQIHQRVADRMYDLFTKNGGLYIKIGKYHRPGWKCLFRSKSVPLQAKP